MIHLAVCDDDREVLKQVECLISQYNESRNSEGKICVASFRSPRSLLANVDDGDDYDVYVLDIEMPEMDGIALARAIRKLQERAVIMFLTSHSSMVFTVESVKLEIARYINKMNMAVDLPEALEVAVKRVEAQSLQYLLVTHYHDVTRIAYQDIIYAHRVKRLTEIVLKGEQTISDGRTLSKVYSVLNDLRFVYIEQGCFVNLDYITRVSGSEITLKSGQKLAVSRNYLPKVKATIFQLWGGV